MENEKKKAKEKETDNKDEETLIESGLQTSGRMRKEAWGWATIILVIAVLVFETGRGIHSWYQSTVVGRAPSVVTTGQQPAT